MTNTRVRVLVAARLSRVRGKDQANRIDRDDEAAETWAKARPGCQIVAVSKDAGVSGSVSPWKRSQLGPWLSDPAQLARYDEIVASSIDRLGRSARDLWALRDWADANEKTIRILSPALVWPPPPDDLGMAITWDVLCRVGEIEYRLIQKRYADMQQTITDAGALFGKPPFGHLVTGDRYAKTLEIDPRLRPYLQGMVDRALRGDTLNSIAAWLEADGVPTSGGGRWSPKTVSGILRNPILKGRRMDREGKRVLLKFDGLLSSAEWAELQTKLDGRPKRRGPTTSATAYLTGVLKCARCNGPMYRLKTRQYVYMRCHGTDQAPSTCRNMVPLADIEGWVDRWFTLDGPFASTEIIETTTVPGDDHAAEVAEIESELRELDFDAPDFDDRQTVLRSERARLKALPSEPAQVVERPTGQTVGEVWSTLDDEARRSYLLAAGTTVLAFGKHERHIFGDPYRLNGTLAQIVA